MGRKNKRKGLWAAGFFIIYITVNIGSGIFISNAAQSKEAVNMQKTEELLISENEKDIDIYSVSGGDQQAEEETVLQGNVTQENIQQKNVEQENIQKESIPQKIEQQEGNFQPDEVISIQVPENLNFVIDPWNLSGLGQIYSQHFVIRNNSNIPCTVQLDDIRCYSEQENGAIIVEDVAEVYAEETPNVYLEMVFQTGKKLVLSPKEKEYTVNLEPDSEIEFWFIGKVNEKTKENWENKKVLVTLKYSCTEL